MTGALTGIKDHKPPPQATLERQSSAEAFQNQFEGLSREHGLKNEVRLNPQQKHWTKFSRGNT